jgi:hypothetical protein
MNLVMNPFTDTEDTANFCASIHMACVMASGD